MANLNRVLQGEFYAGQVHAKIMDLPGPASYATGGVAIAAADVGIGHNILGMTLVQADQATTLLVASVVYDPSTGKLQFFSGSAAGEIPAATNLSSGTYRLLVFGF